jgi:hypothetical protein
MFPPPTANIDVDARGFAVGIELLTLHPGLDGTMTTAIPGGIQDSDLLVFIDHGTNTALAREYPDGEWKPVEWTLEHDTDIRCRHQTDTGQCLDHQDHLGDHQPPGKELA